jgi:putative ABC transport system ATP-binding protein
MKHVPAPAPLLAMRDVILRYGGRPIIGRLSLTIEPGKHLLLLGPSGSGKTSLINLVCGLVTPEAGTIHIAGEPMTGVAESARDDVRRRRIGMVFQTLRLVSALDVLSNVLLAQKLAAGRSNKSEAITLLDRLGLADKARVRPSRLSQGEAQRAAIARALIGRPSLLVADEPTSALDDANMDRVARLFLDCARENGTSLLIATHDERLKAHVPDVLRLATPDVQRVA